MRLFLRQFAFIMKMMMIMIMMMIIMMMIMMMMMVTMMMKMRRSLSDVNDGDDDDTLSTRVCVNYLSSKATFSDWSICQEHSRLLLEAWRPGQVCCHHDHQGEEGGGGAMATVSYAMSRDILRRDGMVLPIGGAVCQACRQSYIRQHIPGLNSINSAVQVSPKDWIGACCGNTLKPGMQFSAAFFGGISFSRWCIS